MPSPGPVELLRRQSGENFPVALWVLPKTYRRHLLAIYVFARFVDYIGDEAPGDRQGLLRKVSRDIDLVYQGRPPREAAMRVLGETVAACSIPRGPLDSLVAANSRDQRTHVYQTYEQLLEYCALSANPIGRLVLHVFGQATPGNVALSDRVCTALQILEHLQDVAEDARCGRVYLPEEDRTRFGVSVEELQRAPASRELRALVAFETQRAVRLLDEGRPLVGRLRGTARVAVAGYVAGGRATVDAIAAAGFDTLSAYPRPSKTRTASLLLRSLISTAVVRTVR